MNDIPSSPPTDHTGLTVLSFDECLSRLNAAPVGRLAFALDGEITILPVNHTMNDVDVCFRTFGDSKIQAALDQDRVAFEVDGYDADTHEGWSVLVQGTAVLVEAPDELRALDEIGRPAWIASLPRGMVWVRVRTHSMTGRELSRTSTAG